MCYVYFIVIHQELSRDTNKTDPTLHCWKGFHTIPLQLPGCQFYSIWNKTKYILFQICEMSDYTRWGEHPTSAGQSVARVPGRVMQRIPLYLNISIWTISIKDTSEIQNIQHRKQIITLTYTVVARMAKCSGPRCPVLLLQHVARVTWYMKSSRQPPAASHQERGGHQFVPLGGSSEAPVSCWSTFKLSTSPHLHISSSHHAHSSPNKVQQLHDSLHSRGLGGGDGGSWQRSVSMIRQRAARYKPR